MSLSERLVAIHRELDELFLLHAECLLERELDLANELLGAYRELLYLHMQHEEDVLLPRYSVLGPLPRFPLVLYTGQHEKLRGMLDVLVTRTKCLGGEARSVRRAVLDLFERHATFKHLLEHHDGAERQGLFAALDAAPSDEIDDGSEAWWDRRHAHEALAERARAILV
ncbi:MAG TPA: hypothetical protein VFV94_10475 [Polyangiaceae bacterium]|jgi:hypothetical protein|nr:hypothetical protein [Polyangiaceae bacterium]